MREPKSWTECDNMWNNSRRRRLANNTYLEREEYHGGSYHGVTKKGSPYIYFIRLHSLRIVTFIDSKHIMLNCGGFATSTTRDRMHRFSPANIWTVKGVWYIVKNNYPDESDMWYFFNGIVVNEKGIPCGKVNWANPEWEIETVHIDYHEWPSYQKRMKGRIW